MLSLCKIKQIDYRIQSILVPLGISLALLLYFNSSSKYNLALCYYIVGSWQLLSVLLRIPEFKKWCLGRRIYVSMVLVLVGLLAPPFTFYGFIAIIFCAPLLALVYFLILHAERRFLRRKSN